MNDYIIKEDVERIKAAAENHLLEVIRDFQEMEEKKGYDFRGVCPICGKETFNYNSKKGLFGCFNRCNVGGADAIAYLMKAQRMNYVDALNYLANKFCVSLTPKAPKKSTRRSTLPKKSSKELRGEDRDSFCTQMLAGSGLTYEDVTAKVFDIKQNSTTLNVHTFTKGTVDSKGNIDHEGNDVIIKYYDLKGYPVTFEQKNAKGQPTGNMKEYFRVRWQFPEEHKDKEGKPFKYKSPYGAGTPIYIPQRVRQAYIDKEEVTRLFIQEGEKKAEKACKHGMLSIAISGIMNIANRGQLPQDLIEFIITCNVKEVFFVMDSDWNDLSRSISINDQVEKRPRNFFYAAKNFKEYLNTLKNRDLYVESYVGHVMPNEFDEKGIDDLLNGSLAGKEHELMDDFNFLVNEKKLTGKFLQFFKVSAYTDYKLKTLWGLDNVRNFAAMHKDVLINLPEFKFGSEKWRFNDDGELESAQAIEKDEKFWSEDERFRKDGSSYIEYSFKYLPARYFLQNRGFGRYRRLDDSWIFVRYQAPFIKRINACDARGFLFDFAENNCCQEVNEMLTKGVTQYVGPDKLALLKFIEPHFLEATGSEQYFYFQKNAWRVTATDVTEVDYPTIDHDVWADEQRQFPAKFLGETLIKFEGEDKDYSYTISKDGKDCHFLQFLVNASNFTWRKKKADIDEDEIKENNQHLLSKLCAIGYMAMSYKNVSVNRAVIAMDGKQSEVGESNGRSGKSLMGVLMQHILPTAYIPGKRRDILEDQFIWNDVVENTRLVFIDDVLINFNFERLFPNLTGDWSVNYKGGARITFPYKKSPKIFIATNHAIKGEGSSFADREWLLGFSDFYNDNHKPIDDFGCNFFDEWDFTQWNLCWNLIANCVQLYLRFGVVQAPLERLLDRRLRQEITEVFISWADEFFSDENHLNRRLIRKNLYDEYCNYDPTMRKFSNSPTEFKKRLMKYCKFRQYRFNPHKYDPTTGKPCKFDVRTGNPIIDDKTGGVEYFTVGTADYYTTEEYRAIESIESKDKRLDF